MELVVPQLPLENRETLLCLLEAGGRVGLERTINREQGNAVLLVAVEPDGTRRNLATLGPAMPPRSETH